MHMAIHNAKRLLVAAPPKPPLMNKHIEFSYAPVGAGLQQGINTTGNNRIMCEKGIRRIRYVQEYSVQAMGQSRF